MRVAESAARWAERTSSHTMPKHTTNMATNATPLVQRNAASPASARMSGPIAVHQAIHAHASPATSQHSAAPTRASAVRVGAGEWLR